MPRKLDARVPTVTMQVKMSEVLHQKLEVLAAAAGADNVSSYTRSLIRQAWATALKEDRVAPLNTRTTRRTTMETYRVKDRP